MWCAGVGGGTHGGLTVTGHMRARRNRPSPSLGVGPQAAQTRIVRPPHCRPPTTSPMPPPQPMPATHYAPRRLTFCAVPETWPRLPPPRHCPCAELARRGGMKGVRMARAGAGGIAPSCAPNATPAPPHGCGSRAPAGLCVPGHRRTVRWAPARRFQGRRCWCALWHWGPPAGKRQGWEREMWGLRKGKGDGQGWHMKRGYAEEDGQEGVPARLAGHGVEQAVSRSVSLCVDRCPWRGTCTRMGGGAAVWVKLECLSAAHNCSNLLQGVQLPCRRGQTSHPVIASP